MTARERTMTQSSPTPRTAHPAVAQARLHRLHGGAGAGLSVLLRLDQLSVLLRRRADPHADRHLAREPAAVSMCAVGIMVPQLVWVVDFVGTAIGYPVVGMTAYMFNAQQLAVPARAVAVPRLAAVPAALSGREARLRPPRACSYWTVLAWVLILICFFFMPPPNPNAGLTPVNINYVWGLNDAAAQTWMPAWAVGDRHDGADAGDLLPAGAFPVQPLDAEGAAR